MCRNAERLPPGAAVFAEPPAPIKPDTPRARPHPVILKLLTAWRDEPERILTAYRADDHDDVEEDDESEADAVDAS